MPSLKKTLRAVAATLALLGSTTASRAAVVRVERVSVASSGAPANRDSFALETISPDGNLVAFTSAANNLTAGNTDVLFGLYLRDRARGTTAKLNASSVSFSADGRWMAFASTAGDLAPGDTNGNSDIFVQDRAMGTVERVSVSSAGTQAYGHSAFPSISADGRVVLFTSAAGDLVPGDTNGYDDLFVHDRITRRTERVNVSSTGAQADSFSGSWALSADGRLVLFTSTATTLDRFPPTSESPRGGLYVRDRLLGTTERVLLPVGGEPRFGGSGRAISADGRYVLFGYAYDFGFRNLAVYDRLTGTTELVSVGPDDAPADADSVQPALSADGRYVAFASSASTLAPGESNGFSQIFLRDRLKGTTQIVSRSVLGSVANGPSAAPVISADGRTVAFISRADNLVPGDTNGVPDVFVVELGDRGPTTRVAVFRPETREWIVQQPDGSGKVIPFGGPGDQPVSAAYLGTGTTAQIAVFRPSTGQWFLRADTGATVGPIALGQAGDIPVPADHLGVGHAQIAVFRPRSGEWRVRGDAGEALPPIRFGETGDAPVPADYLGSGKAQIAVFRARPRRLGLWSGTAQWFLRTDTGATLGPIPFGAAGDVAVPADYLGLHRAQIAVFRPSTGEWLIRRDSGETLRILFGTGGDLPVPGDYLGAGHAQIAVYRPSTGEWFVLGEDGAALRIPWGGPGDQPVPGYYALGFVGVP